MTMDADQLFDAPPPGEPRAPAAKVTAADRLRGFARAAFSTSLSTSTSRIRLVALLFLALFGVIGGRLVFLGFKPDPANLRRAAAEAVAAARPDLLDRNGEILATDVKTMSVFAEPRRLIDKDEATELLTAALPEVDARELRERLGSRKGFVWVKREVTPHQRDEVFHLGLPGVGLLAENKRVYPNGPIGAHVLG
ncbi:MAG: penicillin-binding protein 2, partial [Methylocystis sp.]